MDEFLTIELKIDSIDFNISIAYKLAIFSIIFKVSDIYTIYQMFYIL